MCIHLHISSNLKSIRKLSKEDTAVYDFMLKKEAERKVKMVAKVAAMKRISVSRAPDKNAPVFLNECWPMDFVFDQLFSGKRFRALTILDLFSRECLDIYADKAITEKLSQKCWTGSNPAVAFLSESKGTTALNSSRRHLMLGHTSIMSLWIILVPARQRIMPIWNPSMAVSAMNA